MKVKSDKYFAFGAEIFRSLSRMALGVMVARWAGPEHYAVFVLLLTIEVIAHTLTNSMFAMPMSTIGPGLEKPQRNFLMRLAARKHTQVSLVGALIVLPLAPLLAGGASGWVYFGFAATLALAGVQNYLRTWLGSTFRAKRMFGADLFSTVAPVGALALLWQQGAYDLMAGYWWVRAAGALVSTVLMVRMVLEKQRNEAGELVEEEQDASLDTAEFRSMGKHMLVGSVANSACSRMQPFVLAMVATATDIGIFGAANTFIGPLRMQSVALSSVLRPRLSLHFGKGDLRSGWRAVRMGMFLATGLGLVSVAAFMLFGQFFSVLVFGEAFAELGSVLPWAGLYATLAGATAMLAIVIQTLDSAATTARMRTIAGVISLALLFPFCAKWGPTGAFSALLLAEVYYLAYGAWRLRRLAPQVDVQAEVAPEQAADVPRTVMPERRSA